MNNLKNAKGSLASLSTIGLIALSSLAGVYYYSTPYLTIKKIETAYLDRDAAGVSKFIDYPELRKSIKGQMVDFMVKNIPEGQMVIKGQQVKINAQEIEIGAGLGINKLVNHGSLELVLEMMSDKELHQFRKRGAVSRHPYRVTYTTAYDSMNEFRVNFEFMENKKTFAFILKRDFLTWKVTGLDLSGVLDEEFMKGQIQKNKALVAE